MTDSVNLCLYMQTHDKNIIKIQRINKLCENKKVERKMKTITTAAVVNNSNNNNNNSNSIDNNYNN